MRKNKSLKIFRKLHKWPGIVIALFAILFAASGIVMNHRQTFSSIDVSRNLLPSNYRYQNWNLAAVRGSLPFKNDSLLIFGNIGIWKTTENPEQFTAFNQGFPKGIDSRKIYSVVRFKNELFAGTHFGLFRRNIIGTDEWHKIDLPVKQERIADVNLKKDTLLVLTRHYLLKSTDGTTFETIQLPEPEGYERKTGLFNTLWELHSGELLGLPGKLIVDLLGLVTILLSVTGLLHFFFPKLIKRRKMKQKPVKTLAKTFRTNLRWHNVVGYIFVAFLIINTLAGIHLRPPLLIPIAGKKVGIIPGTHLDSPNPWFDKLRRVEWDENLNQYIFSTSEGFFASGENFAQLLQPIIPQPPVSVMGLNVFKPVGEMQYLTGSFNGMFLWDLQTVRVSDFFSGAPYTAPQGMGNPIGANMAAGLVEAGDNAWWFDYNRGAISLSGKPFPQMPEEILKKSPMSLWNVSLEVHTGRIFEHLVGPFYILYVPLAGLCLIMVLVSGFFVWWKAHRKNKQKK
ncbi:MAG: PepSY domain-containing protein [Mariniphaga sp.]|nr:PepSY domain-containing protein [Mariniphaga sp.]